MDARKSAPAEALPIPPGQSLTPWAWSPDGQRLALNIFLPDGTGQSVLVYDFGSRQVEQVAETGQDPQWLSDSRRLLFTHQGELYLANIQTKKTHEVPSESALSLLHFSLSRDSSMVVYTVHTIEDDIWLSNVE